GVGGRADGAGGTFFSPARARAIAGSQRSDRRPATSRRRAAGRFRGVYRSLRPVRVRRLLGRLSPRAGARGGVGGRGLAVPLELPPSGEIDGCAAGRSAFRSPLARAGGGRRVG